MHFSIEDSGNGMWCTMHVHAASIETEQDSIVFILWMKKYAITFPCEKCRPHFQKYMNGHPLKKGQNAEYYLKWTYEFHEAVNRRLNKKSSTWDEVKKQYMDTLNCSGFCAAESPIEGNKRQRTIEGYVESAFTRKNRKYVPYNINEI